MKKKNESTNQMTSRERVLAAVRGQPVDRIPVMYWLNPHTTCRLLAEYRPSRDRVVNAIAHTLWRRFRRQGELAAGEWTRGLPLLLEEFGNQDYALELGADIAVLSPAISSPAHFLGSIRKRDGRLSFIGPLGSIHGLGGIYPDVIRPAVQTIHDLADYCLPSINESQFVEVRKFCRAHPNVCALVEVMAFQQALSDFIWRTDQFMLALYDYPAEIQRFLARLSDWVVEIVRQAAAAGATIAFLQDDYGGNGHPLISPRMWREITFPHLKRFVGTAHEAGIPLMLHSCGYQMPFLQSYVEAEVDVLQSFQPKAGNNFAQAVQIYGHQLCFATGIDTQQSEWRSPQEVRQSIFDSVKIGKSARGHILSMTHQMQYTMPMENVRAIFETVRELQDMPKLLA